MSQETRAAALAQAVILSVNRPALDVLMLASSFNDFIEGKDRQPAMEQIVEPVKTAVEKKAVKVAAAEKAKAVEAKPVVDYLKIVGNKVNELLKANKRAEAVALLETFDGAKSASGILKQGPDVIKAFLDDADEILAGDTLVE
jgi:hypothetical protein